MPVPKAKVSVQSIPSSSEPALPVVPTSRKPPTSEVTKPIIETYFTVSEVARELNLSRYTVTRRFENLPGVWDAGREERCHRRRYRELRIPKSAVINFVNSRRVPR
jgi:hypothetical protein